jgi:hypothetical protein
LTFTEGHICYLSCEHGILQELRNPSVRTKDKGGPAGTLHRIEGLDEQKLAASSIVAFNIGTIFAVSAAACGFIAFLLQIIALLL